MLNLREMDGKFNELTTSAAVVVGELNSLVDIDAVYRYFQISDDIIQLKCNDKSKTKTSEVECKTFYNQISIKLKNKTNIKIFTNGKFQISGVSINGTSQKDLDNTVERAKGFINSLLEKIKPITGYVEISPVKQQGLYTYKSHILTFDEEGFFNYTAGVIKDGKIIIGSEACVPFEFVTGTYVSVKHQEKKKILYNNIGKKVGYIFYNLKRKSKSLSIKDCVYIKIDENRYDIIDKCSNHIGVLEINLDVEVMVVELPELVKVKFSACNPDTCIVTLSISNYNSNVKLILPPGRSINRDLICEQLMKYDVKYTYNASHYPGIKFTYCDTKVTIFRTGSILFSSKIDISLQVLPFIKKLFETDFIIKKMEVGTPEPDEEELSIFDL
jgi:hypothetical protein